MENCKLKGFHSEVTRIFIYISIDKSKSRGHAELQGGGQMLRAIRTGTLESEQLNDLERRFSDFLNFSWVSGID